MYIYLFIVPPSNAVFCVQQLIEHPDILYNFPHTGYQYIRYPRLLKRCTRNTIEFFLDAVRILFQELFS